MAAFTSILDEPAWALFIAAILALVTLISYPLIVRQSHAPVEQVGPKRDLAVRIDDVPVDKSCEALRDDLRSITAQDLGMKATIDTVGRLSLVRRDKDYACATATISTSIPGAELLKRLNCASKGLALPYRFDCEFYGITPLYESEDGVAVDVVAVPGLASHAIGSWKSTSSSDVWLRDYIPRDIPNVRVLLYGYDTSLLKSESRKSIEDMGRFFLEALSAFRANNHSNRRPIIFIGHSLGGLLVKEALVYAHKKQDGLHDVFETCCGLLFFGVPNHGLRNEQLRSIVQGYPNQNLIHDLVVDDDSEPSAFLKRISDQFSECCKGRYKVVSFSELKKSSTVQIQSNGKLGKTGPKILMVTHKSATSVGLTAGAEEDNVALDTDHSGLVKYDSSSQGPYPIVRERIKSLIKEETCRMGLDERNNLENCRRLLFSPEIESRLDPTDVAETPTWIFENKTYQEWQHRQPGVESMALLTLKGNPGVGKSVLMEQLVQDQVNDDSTITVHHSFQPCIEEANSLESPHKKLIGFLKSLLGQLIRKVPEERCKSVASLAKAACQMADADPWPKHQIQRTIELLIIENKINLDGKVNRFRIFVDAIDECLNDFSAGHASDRANASLELLMYLSHLLKSTLNVGVDIGICVSRGYKNFGGDEPESIAIRLEEHIGSQVQQYILRRLENTNKTHFTHKVASILRQRSTYGFLWAKLAVNRIVRDGSASSAHLETLAGALPTDLEDFYQKSVKRSDLATNETLLHQFVLLVGVVRPVTSDEVRHASAFFRDFDGSENITSIEDWENSRAGFPSASTFNNQLQQGSGNLVEVVPFRKSTLVSSSEGASVFQVDQSGGDLVRFVHPSVADFLYGERGLRHLYQPSSGDLMQNCHFFIFRICLRVLKFSTIEKGDTMKFLDYVCTFWLLHARESGSLVEDLDPSEIPIYLLKCPRQRAKTPKRTTQWSRLVERQMKHLESTQAKEYVYLTGDSADEAEPERLSGYDTSILVLLATFGCAELLAHHFRECQRCGEPEAGDVGESPSFTDRQFQMALENAIRGGHGNTAKLLFWTRSGRFDKGSLTAEDDDLTVLYSACEFEQMDMVRFLLDNGADPAERSPPGWAYEYPLHLAVIKGNPELVQELLQRPHREKAEEILRLPYREKNYTALHLAVTSDQPRPRRKATLEALTRFAPRGLGLLGLKDVDGKTPMELAERVDNRTGSNLFEILELFENDDEVVVS
ncbi:hypothetical protein LZ30DRAFT_243022 [Colletotrichum cereale]|nr:hypothetical protein LZ30DRAFT_243022 [Colletotrichum cereale]